MTDEHERLQNFGNDPSRGDRLNTAERTEPLNVAGGHLTGTISDTAVLLTLEYLPPSPATEPRYLRLAMSRAHCADLARDLATLAILPHRQKKH